VFIGIDSNAHDSDPAIREFAESHGLGFPVLKDESNKVADQALAERTPEVLVLDGRAIVRYRGAIDDQYGQGTSRPRATRTYLKDALEALTAGRPVALKATETPGCIIDRVDPKPSVSSSPRVRPAPPEVVTARRELEGKGQAAVGEVTYAGAAARIIQDRCQSCHRPGQVGPFPLVSYDDVRKHAAMIAEVVDNRRMPPWHADPRYGRFANDRSLSARERATLLAWVEQGAPLGDPAQVPPARSFPEGWTIGKPDVVIDTPQSYTVPAQGVVEYVRLRVPAVFKEDRWIQAAEARPGDRSVVHHIIGYVDDHRSKRGGPGSLAHLCGYAPGDMPSVYSPGTAKLIPAGADLIFEIHYTPIGKVRTDRSSIGLIFAKEPVTREAFTVGIAESGFLIPPHQDNVPVSSSLTFDQDVRLLSFMPHMHLRGKDFKYTIVRPGKAPEVILSVPAYDFGWQSYYTLAEPISLPRGTRIDCLAHYDNSDRNPSNPDPSRTVRWGDQTFEEMMIGYIDLDLPRGARLNLGPLARSQSRSPARGVLQAAAALLGFPGAAKPAPGAIAAKPH
ncbi:MAG: peroxiredoxin, partial [Isosphaeraceae bacterium]